MAIGALACATAGAPARAAVENTLTAAPGQTITLTQSVQAPFVPPRPDIVLVVDRTGSMGPAITDVKSKIAGVIAAVRASEPDARFAVAAYCDSGERTPAYQTIAPLSANASGVIDAMIAMPLCFGGDAPEAQLEALYRVGGSGRAIGFRPQSQRIIAWFGDAPGHSRLRSESAALRSLQAAHARVVAVSVGKNQLDASGQAGRITRATGGTLVSGVSPDQVAGAILQGITSLPVTVAAEATCDPGISVALTPDQRIARGETATFSEKVQLAPEAVVGSSLSCLVRFTMDGVDLGPDFEQRIVVTVSSDPADVESPDGESPDGDNAGGESPAGDNPDAESPDGADPGEPAPTPIDPTPTAEPTPLDQGAAPAGDQIAGDQPAAGPDNGAAAPQ